MTIKAKVSATPEQLTRWLANLLGQGMTDILVTRSARDGSPAVVHDKVSPTWSAPACVSAIFEACKGDAEILGGRQVYRVVACDIHGAEISGTSIAFETGRDAADPLSSSSPEVQFALRIMEGVNNKWASLFDRMDKVLERTYKQNQDLHDKSIAQLSAVESALNMSNEREIARMEAENMAKIKDKSADAILRAASIFGPTALGKKMGLPPEVVRGMVESIVGTPGAPATPATSAPAQASSTDTLASVLATLPDVAIIELLHNLPSDQVEKLFAALPPESKAKVGAILAKLENS
jgi:hypothetical protein